MFTKKKICVILKIYILTHRGDLLEKKLAIVLGIIAAVFIAMVVTKGEIGPYLAIGVLAYAIYKNNRY